MTGRRSGMALAALVASIAVRIAGLAAGRLYA